MEMRRTFAEILALSHPQSQGDRVLLAVKYLEGKGGVPPAVEQLQALFEENELDLPPNVTRLLRGLVSRGFAERVQVGDQLARFSITRLGFDKASNMPSTDAESQPTDNILKAIFDAVIADPGVKAVSGPLFRDGHYSQSILEAFKLVNNIVKERSGLLEKDGRDLMFGAFATDRGPLRLNPGISVSERDEQEGFMQIYAGAMLGVRNPKAHDNIVQKDPVRTLQYLALASLLAARAKEATSGPDSTAPPASGHPRARAPAAR